MEPFLSIEGNVKKRVVIAMSGGVDSSVAAALLKEQGYEVIGVTMELWDGHSSSTDQHTGYHVVAEAQKVADQLNIPFYSFDLKADFHRQVIEPFCAEYLNGRTPNPCIICNKFLKFGQLLDIARKLDAESLATGHYVGLVYNDGYFKIRKGVDHHKDQSYFLFALNQNQLSKCLFPLGDMNKIQVRNYAARLNLSVAGKSESQDICFIPDGDYSGFLQKERQVDSLPGDIVHVSGQFLGRHQGIYQYTVGQRKGLGIGWTEPLYVVAINAAKQQVVVGEKLHLSQTDLLVAQCHWSIPFPDKPFPAYCRLRYRHTEMPAVIEPLVDGQVKVVFESAQQGITPGQAAVFYKGDLVIGGGWIV